MLHEQADTAQPVDLAAGLTVVPRFQHGRVIKRFILDGYITIGWLDVTTDEVHVDSAHDRPRAEAAVQAWHHAKNRNDDPLANRDATAIGLPDEKHPSDMRRSLPATTATARAEALTLDVDPFAPLHDRVSPEAERWQARADAEEALADALDALSERWTVVHDVPLAGTGLVLSHVLIGPGGLFAITVRPCDAREVVVHGNRVRIGTTTTTDIAEAVRESGHARRLINKALGFETPLQSVLVLAGPRHIESKNPTENVHVLTPDRLIEHLNRQHSALSPWEITSVKEACQRLSTWQPS